MGPNTLSFNTTLFLDLILFPAYCVYIVYSQTRSYEFLNCLFSAFMASNISRIESFMFWYIQTYFWIQMIQNVKFWLDNTHLWSSLRIFYVQFVQYLFTVFGISALVEFVRISTKLERFLQKKLGVSELMPQIPICFD